MERWERLTDKRVRELYLDCVDKLLENSTGSHCYDSFKVWEIYIMLDEIKVLRKIHLDFLKEE